MTVLWSLMPPMTSSAGLMSTAPMALPELRPKKSASGLSVSISVPAGMVVVAVTGEPL